MQEIRKYFPHIASSLVLASAGTVGLMHDWEPDTRFPDAHLYVYADKLARGVPTACNGLTNAVSQKKLVLGEKWTEQECETNEAIALTNLQNKLAQCFKIAPPQSVFDSATSHAWNMGVNKTCSSEAMKQWNKGNFRQGCQLIAFQYDGKTPNWSFSDGKFVQGLHNRRLAEMQVCMKDLK